MDSNAQVAVSVTTATSQGDGDDVENGPQGQDGYTLLTGDDVSVFIPCISDSWAVNSIYGTQDGAVHRRYSSGSPYRVLFPFFLIIIVVLLLVWRLVVSPGLIPVKYAKCPEGSSRVVVVAGDTCWKIGEAHGCGLEALRKVNTKLVCERLMPGDQICVPSAALDS
jgi:hypothetical protein